MIPTAKEFFKGIHKHEDYLNIACAFARIHVHLALKTASEKAKVDIIPVLKVYNINREEILESYPLENIK